MAVLTRDRISEGFLQENVLPFHQAAKKSGRNNTDRITEVVVRRGFTVYKDGYFVSCEIPTPKGVYYERSLGSISAALSAPVFPSRKDGWHWNQYVLLTS